MASLAIKAIFYTILPFYRVDFPVSALPNQFTFIEYTHGMETSKKQLLKGDREFSELVAMFNDERPGWKYDLSTYAPQRIFKSTGMTINCLGTTVVVNYEDKDLGWVQLSKVLKRECPVVVMPPATS